MGHQASGSLWLNYVVTRAYLCTLEHIQTEVESNWITKHFSTVLNKLKNIPLINYCNITHYFSFISYRFPCVFYDVLYKIRTN